MRAADDLISQLGKTRDSLDQSDDEEEQEVLQQRGMKMICDETSCVIVPLAEAADRIHGPSGSPSKTQPWQTFLPSPCRDWFQFRETAVPMDMLLVKWPAHQYMS